MTYQPTETPSASSPSFRGSTARANRDLSSPCAGEDAQAVAFAGASSSRSTRAFSRSSSRRTRSAFIAARSPTGDQRVARSASSSLSRLRCSSYMRSSCAVNSGGTFLTEASGRSGSGSFPQDVAGVRNTTAQNEYLTRVLVVSGLKVVKAVFPTKVVVLRGLDTLWSRPTLCCAGTGA